MIDLDMIEKTIELDKEMDQNDKDGKIKNQLEQRTDLDKESIKTKK